MNIEFCFAWHEAKRPLRRSFKLPGTFELFEEYRARISKFTSAEAGGIPDLETIRKSGSKIWICHTSKESKTLSSEKIAERLDHLKSTGVRKLYILIGGADGFSTEQVRNWSPDLLWNFGPMTLPHELAAVVAGEQIYRAWTILHGLPYHSGH